MTFDPHFKVTTFFEVEYRNIVLKTKLLLHNRFVSISLASCYLFTSSDLETQNIPTHFLDVADSAYVSWVEVDSKRVELIGNKHTNKFTYKHSVLRRECVTQICIARTSYGNVSVWVSCWLAGWLSVTAGVVSKRLNLS